MNCNKLLRVRLFLSNQLSILEPAQRPIATFAL